MTSNFFKNMNIGSFFLFQLIGKETFLQAKLFLLFLEQLLIISPFCFLLLELILFAI